MHNAEGLVVFATEVVPTADGYAVQRKEGESEGRAEVVGRRAEEGEDVPAPVLPPIPVAWRPSSGKRGASGRLEGEW